MKHIHLSLIAIITLFATSCHSAGNGDSSSSERTPDSVAISYGVQHAQKLIDAEPDTTAMRRVLLDTRAYETSMRQEGLNNSADDYIKAFEDYIRSNDTPLAVALGL